MWILDHKRDTLYRVSDRVFSLSKDEALGRAPMHGSGPYSCAYRGTQLQNRPKSSYSAPYTYNKAIDR